MDQCETQYPIMLVHGTGFRDRSVFGYWGRIPKILEAHGATIVYGNQDSWGTIEDNARRIQRSLDEALQRLQTEKVNIIAHSKGGLEARYLVSSLGYHAKVASITTISTPHSGSQTMDYVFRIPKVLIKAAAGVANAWFKLLGDQNPRFYEACRQFTTRSMQAFNNDNPDADGVYYQSYATRMKGPFSDLFLTVPYLVTRLVEGDNDGLVALDSAKWTNFQGTWTSNGRRGISHADSVDARRRRFSAPSGGTGIADITAAYIDVVANLKSMGF